ncbi:exodeoxyribonuclease I, partial [Francisella tularensis subsp. holarctica]|nr:exodeoxyribonuclease I [Francisella tularensis subsp. holarctica]
TCYYFFCNDVLKWPKDFNEGVQDKTSLKLENLNQNNYLYSGGRAHDAITYVFVTVELDKKLRAANPTMWQFLLAKFNK